MKKLFLTILFFAGTMVTLAQVEKVDDRQETDQDKIQQEPQSNAQIDLERRTRIEQQRTQNETAAKKTAKKLARKKARQEGVSREPVKK